MDKAEYLFFFVLLSFIISSHYRTDRHYGCKDVSSTIQGTCEWMKEQCERGGEREKIEISLYKSNEPSVNVNLRLYSAN